MSRDPHTELAPVPGDPWPYEHLAPATITCVDCGGVAHLLTSWDRDEPPQPGDLTTYRCADCDDRWDVVIPDDGEGDVDRGD